MKWHPARLFLISLMIISLAIVPPTITIIMQNGRVTLQHDTMTLELGEREVVVNDSDIRLVFNGTLGYALTEFSTNSDTNVINYAAFYVGANVTARSDEADYYSDIYDTNASVDVIEYSANRTVFRIIGELVSSNGQVLQGVRIVKTFEIAVQQKTLHANILVLFGLAPPTLQWLKVSVSCKKFLSKWAYGYTVNLSDEDYYLELDHGDFSGKNAYAYLVNNLRWMEVYESDKDHGLILGVVDPSQFLFKSSENGTRTFGSWDGEQEGERSSTLDAFWSIPDRINEGDFASADLHLTIGSAPQ